MELRFLIKCTKSIITSSQDIGLGLRSTEKRHTWKSRS